MLKDLCARLPYSVKVQIDFGKYCIKYGIDRYVDDTVICAYPETFEIGVNDEDQACDIEDVKPYLRPISSMTEDEDKDFALIQTDFYVDGFLYPFAATNMVDWLNAHHFDYRGLIEKGFAIEAPEGMYE